MQASAISLLSFLSFLITVFCSSEKPIDATKGQVYDLTVRPYGWKTLKFRMGGSNEGRKIIINVPTSEGLSQYHKDHPSQECEPFVAISARFFGLLRGSKGNIEALFGEGLRKLEWEAWECFSKFRPAPCDDRMIGSDKIEKLEQIMRTIVLGAANSFPLADFLLVVDGTACFSPTKFLCILLNRVLRHGERITNNESLRVMNDNPVVVGDNTTVKANEAAVECFGRLPPELVPVILGLCGAVELFQLSQTCQAFRKLLDYCNMRAWYFAMVSQRHIFDAASMVHEILFSGYPESIKHLLLRKLVFVGEHKGVLFHGLNLERFPFYIKSTDIDLDGCFGLFQTIFQRSQFYSLDVPTASGLVYSLRGLIKRYHVCGSKSLEEFVTHNASFISKFIQFIATNLGEKVKEMLLAWDGLFSCLTNITCVPEVTYSLMDDATASEVFEAMANGTILRVTDCSCIQCNRSATAQ